MKITENKILLALVSSMLFWGWIWSGWTYLKGHVPSKIWDETRVSIVAEG